MDQATTDNAVTTEGDARPLAFSYARFSSPEQAKGDSLRRQTSKARAYALRHDLKYEDRSFHDLGISAFRGANVETGRLGDFMRCVQEGAIPHGSFLLVENLDRISRQTPRKAARTLENICDLGVNIVTLDDEKVYTAKTLDDSLLDFLIVVLKFSRAWDESDRKETLGRANWHRKREMAKAEKRPMTSRCPAWIRLTPTGYEAIPERAIVIVRIFDLASKGVGQQQIADILNEERVPTFGDHFTSRKAEFWRRSYIKKILASETVIGVLRTYECIHMEEANKTERRPIDVVPGYYPVVVSEDVFRQVEGMREKGREAPRAGRAGIRNILAGLARCPACGATMTRVTKGSRQKAGKPFLVCTRAKQGRACRYVSVPLHLIDAAVAWEAPWLAKMVPSHDVSLEAEMKRWSSEFAASITRIGELTEALRAEPTSMVAALLATEQRRAQAVHERLQQALLDADSMTSMALRRRLQHLDEIMRPEERDIPQANALLRQCFSSVVVDYDAGLLRFEWRVGGQVETAFLTKGCQNAPALLLGEGDTMRLVPNNDLGFNACGRVSSLDVAVWP